MPVTSDGTVQVRANGESVGFAGLATCASVWVCPVCNARIQAVRRLQVGVDLASLEALGGGAAFGAYTVRHHAGQALAVVLDGLTYGLARIGQDKAVKSLRAEMGYLGRIQALEVTFGANGPHPHRHPLVMFKRPPARREVERLHAAEFRAFAAGVRHRGMQSPLAQANVLAPVAPGTHEVLGSYFAKSGYALDRKVWGVDSEMTSSQAKKGRLGSRTPWEVLDSARLGGNADDLAIWNEYERTMHGKRAITYTRGLRDALGTGVEATDEQIADAEVGDRADAGFVVTDWTPVQRNARLGAQLLNVVGVAGNWQAGRDFCRAFGIAIEEIDS